MTFSFGLVRRLCRCGGRGHALELHDQVAVIAGRLGLILLELIEQDFHAVERRKDQRHRFAGDARAVAEFAHQRFRGMRERFEPRQIEEAAGPFDGVDETEDVVEDLRVVGVLLEAHELDVDDVDALVRFGEEVPKQFVHGGRGFQIRKSLPIDDLLGADQCVGKGFNFRACARCQARLGARVKLALAI